MNSLQKSLKIIKKAEELKNPDNLAVNILTLEEKVEEIKEIADNTRKQKGETGNRGRKETRAIKENVGKRERMVKTARMVQMELTEKTE